MRSCKLLSFNLSQGIQTISHHILLGGDNTILNVENCTIGHEEKTLKVIIIMYHPKTYPCIFPKDNEKANYS